MRFDYWIDEYIRATRNNNVVVDIPDDELAQLASECDDREEFEDKLKDWLYECEWDNVDNTEINDEETDDSEHNNDFYEAISEAWDRFFQEEEDGEVEGRRKL